MYKSFSESDFINDVKNVHWDTVLQCTHAEVALNTFCKLFSAVCDRHAPIKKFSVRSSRSPWLDGDLKRVMKERDQLKKTAVASGNSADWQAYRSLRNKVTQMNRQKKKHYYKTKFDECGKNSKQIWKMVNELLGRTDMSKMSSLIEDNGTVITKPFEIANYFNNYYEDKVKVILSEMSQFRTGISETIIREKIMFNRNCSFVFQHVENDNILKILKNINCEKPCGIDYMDGKLLKIAAESVVIPLCYIFNLCFENCIYPNSWKIAKVIPLAKNTKQPLTGKNSRPISILPVLSKLMEGIMFNQIQHYFEVNQLQSDTQHAYKEGYSTSTALTVLTDEWLRQIDNNKLVGVAYLDFSAAFDLVDHHLLLEKLSAYGFKQSAMSFLSSYLADRKQCVAFNGSLSDIVTLTCGIPQGSCLGPLLYSIFVNDMSYVLHDACMTVYADDTTVHVSASNTDQVNSMLQQGIMDIDEWVVENRLKLNVSKTKCMIIGSKHSMRKDPKLNIYLKNQLLEQVAEIKLLGVTLDQTMSWTTHIGNIVTTMSRNVSLIRRNAHFMSLETRKFIVQSLVLCHLDYCSTVWASAAKKDLDKLQVVQNRAARLALACPFRTNVNSMHHQLSWMKVNERLAFRAALSLHKIWISHRPFSLFSKLLPTCNRHGFETRQAYKATFCLPLPRTNALKHTFIYRAVSYWNMLPPEIMSLTNAVVFKIHLRKAFINGKLFLHAK